MTNGEFDRGVALSAARNDIAGRIRGVCANFSEAEFAELVDRMAMIEIRYRFRDDWVALYELATRARPSFN